jgi:ADP-ribose pyrophosphatase YjhB (NUDIX family)
MPKTKTPEGWLSARDWARAQATLPIACVDVFVYRRRARRIEVGLILRDVPHQGRRWCLVGGRLRRGERLEAAIHRQVRETLGPTARCAPRAPLVPLFIAEYMPRRVRGTLYDPRQHAIGLTYAARVSGPIVAQGEAYEFRWLDAAALGGVRIGFDQKRVIAACLSAIHVLT